MLRYIIKRIFIFIPTLIVISLIGFVISVNAPGDPVERLVNSAQQGGGIGNASESTEELKAKVRKRLNLHLPVFYFRLSSLAEPDTLYRVNPKSHRENLETLIQKNGNWSLVSNYYQTLNNTLKKQRNLEIDPKAIPNYSGNEIQDILNKSRINLLRLMETTEDQAITNRFNSLKRLYARYGFLEPLQGNLQDIRKAYLKLISGPQRWKTYIPAINWHGFNNQYHEWITGIVFHLDFGRSYRDQQPVMDRIEDRFIWSFSLALLSIIIAYLISIPVGIYSAYRRNSAFDRGSAVFLFALIALPNFFVGTLLLFLFANPDILVWFPEAGVQNATTFQEDWSFFTKLQHHLPYLVLPLITYTYASFAFLTRQMRVGLLDVINKDFIRTARAKGLKEWDVIMKHALRNGLLPVITLFSNIFPLALGGSVIVEKIFSIPGMGLEIYQAILSADYPMIVAIFTLVGFLTIIGYLVADILYALVDPRISYS